MDSNLQTIVKWAKVRAPQTLQHLNSPASEPDIQAVEREVGVTLPQSFKALLRTFDGEDGQTWLALFGNGNQLLSCQRIIEQYQLERRIGGSLLQSNKEFHDIEFWKDRTAEGVIFVRGRVKPLVSHPKWVPITCMNGDVLRYLDYDPAPGGGIGQVIEVDPEGCSYQVLADSFDRFLAEYAQQLEEGMYSVDGEGYIESIEEPNTLTWGIPEWLQ